MKFLRLIFNMPLIILDILFIAAITLIIFILFIFTLIFRFFAPKK